MLENSAFAWKYIVPSNLIFGQSVTQMMNLKPPMNCNIFVKY